MLLVFDVTSFRWKLCLPPSNGKIGENKEAEVFFLIRKFLVGPTSIIILLLYVYIFALFVDSDARHRVVAQQSSPQLHLTAGVTHLVITINISGPNANRSEEFIEEHNFYVRVRGLLPFLESGSLATRNFMKILESF